MITVHIDVGSPGDPIARGFARGLELAGESYRVTTDQTAVPGLNVVWGVLRGMGSIIKTCQRQGWPFIHIDHAYLARGHAAGNYRATVNALQLGAIVDRPVDRAALFGFPGAAVSAWQAGDEVLVLAPSAHVTRFFDIHDAWAELTVEYLKLTTRRPVRLRAKTAAVPLTKDLERCHAVVTLNSNAAVEAIIEGTPAFVGPWSAARPVARSLDEMFSIENPLYSDHRERWLAHLAYGQFTFDEFRTGEAWKILKPQIPAA